MGRRRGDPRLRAGADRRARRGSVRAARRAARGRGEADGVGGGWFGTLGYALGARVEALPPLPPRPVPLPAFSLAYYDHVLRLDDAGGAWWFEALESDAGAERLRSRLETLRARLGGAAPAAVPYALAPFAPRPGPDGHEATVRWCRRHIAAGDLYQANLTLRLESQLDGDAIDLFAAAAGRVRPARAAFVGDADRQVASLSPELFLERRGRHVRTAPIKGPRRTAATATTTTAPSARWRHRRRTARRT